MISGEVLSLSLRVRTNAYMSHATEEIPQLLCIPPRLWRRDVVAVLIGRGTQDLPRTLTASQNTTRRKASLRQSVKTRMFAMEKRAARFLAYGKCPVAASTKPMMFTVKQTTKSLLYTVNSPWSSKMTDNLDSCLRAGFGVCSRLLADGKIGFSSFSSSLPSSSRSNTKSASLFSSSSSSRSRSQK
ncbi:hypothetical protein QQP08_020080 [Theobroma cacao]|nr:hypothetical protein QQP08_020080 [Theobroma cacao]